MPKVTIHDDASGDELASWYINAVPRAGEYVRVDGEQRKVARVVHELRHIRVIVQ